MYSSRIARLNPLRFDQSVLAVVTIFMIDIPNGIAFTRLTFSDRRLLRDFSLDGSRKEGTQRWHPLDKHSAG
jgi:hypothetical protein